MYLLMEEQLGNRPNTVDMFPISDVYHNRIGNVWALEILSQ
jgi:hypothetical protein